MEALTPISGPNTTTAVRLSAQYPRSTQPASPAPRANTARTAAVLPRSTVVTFWSNTTATLSPVLRPAAPPLFTATTRTMTGADGTPHVPVTKPARVPVGAGDDNPPGDRTSTPTPTRSTPTSTVAGTMGCAPPPASSTVSIAVMGDSHATLSDPSDGVNTTGVAGVFVPVVNTTVTTSPTLNPGTSGSGLDAVTDSSPGQHAAAPSSLPACVSAPGTVTHGVHAARDVAAADGEYVSLGQGEHAIAPEELYHPAVQGSVTPWTQA